MNWFLRRKALKYLLLGCFIGGMMLGCKAPVHEKEMRSGVTALFAALNGHNLENIGRCYSDSARIESVNWEGSENGPAGVRKVYARYFASSPDLKYTITNITIGKGTAVVEYTSAGTMTHLEKEVPAYYQGKSYTLRHCARLDFSGGKIAHEYTYFDRVSFLAQMGFFDNR